MGSEQCSVPNVPCPGSQDFAIQVDRLGYRRILWSNWPIVWGEFLIDFSDGGAGRAKTTTDELHGGDFKGPFVDQVEASSSRVQ